MKNIRLIFILGIFSQQYLCAQLTPMDIQYNRTIPNDSLLLEIDSMIITKFQVYLPFNTSLSCHPNRPTNMKAYIVGYEYSDSISLQSIKSKISIQLSDSQFVPDTWHLAVIKPGRKQQSFIEQVDQSSDLTNGKILDSIDIGDFISISCVTAWSKSLHKLYDLTARLYRVVE